MIHSTPFWLRGNIPGPCCNCVFINMGNLEKGMKGLLVACIYLFCRFLHCNINYPCTLVHWFSTSNKPDASTGLWVVQPESTHWRARHMSIIHLNTIICGAHLLLQFPSDTPVYQKINYMNTLDLYASFYVNKFIDHHTFEIAF